MEQLEFPKGFASEIGFSSLLVPLRRRRKGCWRAPQGKAGLCGRGRGWSQVANSSKEGEAGTGDLGGFRGEPSKGHSPPVELGGNVLYTRLGCVVSWYVGGIELVEFVPHAPSGVR